MQILGGSNKDELNREFQTMVEKKSQPTNHLVEKVKVSMINKVIKGVESMSTEEAAKSPLSDTMK